MQVSVKIWGKFTIWACSLASMLDRAGAWPRGWVLGVKRHSHARINESWAGYMSAGQNTSGRAHPLAHEFVTVCTIIQDSPVPNFVYHVVHPLLPQVRSGRC